MTREEARLYIIQHCNPDYPNGNTEWETAMNIAISALQQPEIIRCKDCTRFKKKRGCNLVEGLNVAKTDSFCSYAERKEEQEYDGKR